MQKLYPFKFLDAYTRKDSQFFFGRNEEIEQLYNMVFQSDLLLVYGASGTGKTSLIQCGLASRFETHEWLPLFIRRGNDLNESFEKVIFDNGGVIDLSGEDLDWLDQDLTEGTDISTKSISTLSKQFRIIYLKNFKPIYIIFDQFEELYILGKKEEQEIFFQTVKELLLLEQPVKMIFSIREEYLGHLYEFERKVPELLRKKIRVEPMTFDKVKSVMKGVGNLPQSNVSILKDQENDFCEKVFQIIKGEENRISIELPYLQVFLDKLYLDTTGDENRHKEAVLSLELLDNLGNIGDVLRSFIDEQVMLAASELGLKPDLIWHILSPFVTLEGTKEPLSLNDIYNRLLNISHSGIAQTIQFFENKRILRYLEKDQMYEIAHDSLARQINTRRSDEEIALLEVLRLIKSHSALKDDAREFFSAKQLAFIEPFLGQLQLTPKEILLIDQSRDACDRERKDELKKIKEKKRRQRNVILIIILAAITSVLFGFWGVINMEKAQNKEQELRKVQYNKNMNNGYQLQRNAEYEKAIEAYKQASDFNDDSAVKDSIVKCQTKLENKGAFEIILHRADSLYNIKEYLPAFNFYLKAQATGYKDIRESLVKKKRNVIDELRKDLTDYEFHNLVKLKLKTQSEIDSINAIKNL